MSEDRTCKNLILLVGSNPIPNYIAARVLKPEKIILLYTSETEKPMKRQEEMFGTLSMTVKSPPYCVKATDPQSIQKSLSNELSEIG